MTSKTASASKILKELATKSANLPAITIQGTAVAPKDVAKALQQAEERMRPNWLSIPIWLLFSVALSLVVLASADIVGLAVRHLAPQTFLHEILFHGDILLISAAFACEAVGSLLDAAMFQRPVRLLMGAFYLALLFVSFAVMACCYSLPSEPLAGQPKSTEDIVRATQITQTEDFVRICSVPLFLITILSVSVTKLKREA
jgi:hypothetical protein